MSDHQASVTNFCAHEFKRDETSPSSTAIIWRCEKCNAAHGNTVPQSLGSTHKANLKASA